MADVATLPAGDLALQTYIAGLTPTWTSTGGSGGTRGTNADHIQVDTGAAWIPSLGYMVNVPSALRPASNASLTASTWYYLYLYVDGANNPQVELVTTAPSAVYKGDARTKTGDTSRRYLGACRIDSGSTILNFKWIGDNRVWYLQPVGGARVLSNGSATTETTVSCATVVPPTSHGFFGLYTNNSASQSFHSSTSEDNFALSSGSYLLTIGPSNKSWVEHPLDSSQAFTYLMSAASGSMFVDLLGYIEKR